MRPEDPIIRWDWIASNLDQLGQRTLEHLQLTAIAVSIGFAIAFVLVLLVRRQVWLQGPVVGIAGILYAIPSLALFGILIPFTGLSTLTAEIALVGYTLLILIRNLLAGLNGVSPEILDAADGMGFSRVGRFWRVELPIAVPVIIAGLRIATVTTIGLVTVTTLIGFGGLGYIIIDIGYTTLFPTAMIVGSLAAVLLAVVADLAFVVVQRWLTPWTRRRAA